MTERREGKRAMREQRSGQRHSVLAVKMEMEAHQRKLPLSSSKPYKINARYNCSQTDIHNNKMEEQDHNLPIPVLK